MKKRMSEKEYFQVRSIDGKGKLVIRRFQEQLDAIEFYHEELARKCTSVKLFAVHEIIESEALQVETPTAAAFNFSRHLASSPAIASGEKTNAATVSSHQGKRKVA